MQEYVCARARACVHVRERARVCTGARSESEGEHGGLTATRRRFFTAFVRGF